VTEIAGRALERTRGVGLPTLLGIAALAGAYYGAAQIGYALDVAGPVAALIWLPVGVGISFLYLGGLSLAPGIVLGDLLVNDYTTLPLGSALGQTIGNLLEVVVTVVVLRRLVPRSSPIATVRGVGCLVVAIGLGTTLSATIGSGSLWAGGVIARHELPTVWRTWLLGDFVGALVIVPLALAWHHLPPRRWWRTQGLETGLMVTSIAAITVVALAGQNSLTYLIYPALVWAALRLGQRGATLAIATSAILAVWRTAHNVGPFHFTSITRTVLSTQLFIIVAALSTLLLAAATSERESLADEVRRSRTRLVEAGDVERRRIERDIHDGAQQRLTALAYKLRRALDQSKPETPETALLEEAETELLVAIDEVREIAHGVLPSVLTDLGLTHAIKSIAARSIVPVTLRELPSARYDGTAEATAYYVVAEAVANAHKHADPQGIEVRVQSSHRFLLIEVADDGRGGAREENGLGIQGLRDRVEAVGGSFGIDSRVGVGTRVTAVIPATILGA
jgi:signal transduction histidine kinase